MVTKRPSPVIVKDGTDNDFKLKKGKDVWIKVGKLSVWLVDNDENGSVDVSIYRDGKEAEHEALASCIAYQSEAK